MRTIYAGGCACGAIRYETNAMPVFENHCQCRQCQKHSGTGHASYLTFADRADVTMSGSATIWLSKGDSGDEKRHAFCPICGTPVYLTFGRAPKAIAFLAGSLDDPGLFAPKVVTYGMRALAWDVMDPALTTFERMPG